tara:strand:+ start:336 stop:440 length:105 start_codon:yes stop_codon:yes gene_type:complete
MNNLSNYFLALDLQNDADKICDLNNQKNETTNEL